MSLVHFLLIGVALVFAIGSALFVGSALAAIDSFMQPGEGE